MPDFFVSKSAGRAQTGPPCFSGRKEKHMTNAESIAIRLAIIVVVLLIGGVIAYRKGKDRDE